MSATTTVNATVTTFNTWRDKLIDWTSSEAGSGGDKNLMAFAKATNSNISTEQERIAAVSSTPDAIALAVNENRKIVIIHGVKNLGGTLVRPDNKVVALSGLSHEAKIVLLSEGEDTAFGEIKTRCPKYSDIKDCPDRDSQKSLPLLRTDNGCAWLCGIVLPPPFQAKAILEFVGIQDEVEFDPWEVLDVVMAAAKNFDSTHGGTKTIRMGGWIAVKTW
jgi:hypothetical protein